MTEQTCGNCKHGIGWTMTKHTPPRINGNHHGHCVYELPSIVWPISIALSDQRMPPKGGIWKNDSDCPCWEAKPCKS